jgi:hypothetical protein
MSDPNGTTEANDEHGLARARENRASVRRTSGALEGALAAASRRDPEGWLAAVTDAVAQLAAAFERHIVANEAPGGLLADMVTQSPRLAHQAEMLRRDHDSLTAEIAALAAGVAAAGAGSGDSGSGDSGSGDGGGGASLDMDHVSDVRTRGLSLLHHLSAHRHLGVEIVYEAYFVDIEAAD